MGEVYMAMSQDVVRGETVLYRSCSKEMHTCIPL